MARLLLPLGLGAVGIGIGCWAHRRVRRTTLEGPCWWVLAAIAAISGVECLVATTRDPSSLLWLRLPAACLIFCPVISLLGAKRPQNRGWHLVVLSLWVILVLPALEAWLLKPGQAADVRGLRAGFMVLLIVMGLVNGLPTRYWLSSLLLALAQIQLLANYLPVPAPFQESIAASSATLGLALAVAALVAAAQSAASTRRAVKPLDQLWLDFRDAYGLLWSLRVAEQVNAAATMYEWDLLLRWGGFHRADGSVLSEPLPEEVERTLKQTLHNLLRRFVSPDWISARLSA